MKGYKGFSKGMVCRGKQYAENTVFALRREKTLAGIACAEKLQTVTIFVIKERKKDNGETDSRQFSEL